MTAAASSAPRPFVLCTAEGLSANLADTLASRLQLAGFTPVADAPEPFVLVLLLPGAADAALAVRAASRGARRLLVVLHGPGSGWTCMAGDCLAAGATDVLAWDGDAEGAGAVAARLARWSIIEDALADPDGAGRLVGTAPAFTAALQQAVEAALFSESPVLVTGESGTGKELIARLVDRLDPRSARRGPVLVDCTNIQAELAGSELFGHERGAFTGAVGPRDGAFALADGGTLFLDEIGELPLPLQAQLLRVLQEGTFRRVGGNAWHRSRFRLVAATNRDLPAMVAAGAFRADLYWRLAGIELSLPALRDRPGDVLPLARHFLAELTNGAPPQLDPAVEAWLLDRTYPGNIRELRQVVGRLLLRWAGAGPLTIGCIPGRPGALRAARTDRYAPAVIEAAVRDALSQGIGLKEIGRMAEETAVRIAVERGGSLQVAAQQLGVTARALQLRCKAAREMAAATG